MATVTCHTPGCAKNNQDVPDVGVTTENENGETVPVDMVICGVCGQEITDIRE